MKKIAYGVAFLAISVSGAAVAGEKLTISQMRETIVGNTTRFNVGMGVDQNFYYAPDGKLYAKNTVGETGDGTWSISDEDGKICRTWVNLHSNWTKIRNGCNTFEQIGENTLLTSGGTTMNLLPGDAVAAAR